VLAGSGGVALPQSFFDALERDGRQMLAEAETAIRQQHPGLDVGLDLYTADPVPTLIEVSFLSTGTPSKPVASTVRKVSGRTSKAEKNAPKAMWSAGSPEK
jgi:hypothetical protein